MGISSAPYVLASAVLFCVPHMVLIFYVCYMFTMKADVTQYLRRKYETLKRCVQIMRLNLISTQISTENKELDNEEQRRLIPVYTYGSV